jgi:hypothetical protein
MRGSTLASAPVAYATHVRERVTVSVAGVLRVALLVLLAGNLVRLPALTAGAREAPILVNDLAVLAVLLVGALAMATRGRFYVDGAARMALVFAAVGAVSAALAVPRFGLTVRELVFSLAYLARWLVYFGLYVVIVNCVSRVEAPRVWAALETMILVFSLFGIVQSAFLPGFAQLVYPDSQLYVDWDPQGRRLVSSFLDPNFAGALVCIGLLCAVARLTCGERVAGWRVGVLVTALLLTASRSSLLATIAGGAVIALVVGVSRRVVRLMLVVGALTLPAVPALLAFGRAYGKLEIDASALSRLVSWLRALRMLADHWLIGVGFNTYGFAQRAYGFDPGRGAFGFSLDGGLLFVAVMTGVVGLAFYVGMLWRIGQRARAVWRSRAVLPVERAMAVACVACTVALLVHSLFVNSLLSTFIMEPLWILWALPFAALRPGPAGGAP